MHQNRKLRIANRQLPGQLNMDSYAFKVLSGVVRSTVALQVLRCNLILADVVADLGLARLAHIVIFRVEKNLNANQ